MPQNDAIYFFCFNSKRKNIWLFEKMLAITFDHALLNFCKYTV